MLISDLMYFSLNMSYVRVCFCQFILSNQWSLSKVRRSCLSYQSLSYLFDCFTQERNVTSINRFDEHAALKHLYWESGACNHTSITFNCYSWYQIDDPHRRFNQSNVECRASSWISNVVEAFLSHRLPTWRNNNSSQVGSVRHSMFLATNPFEKKHWIRSMYPGNM